MYLFCRTTVAKRWCGDGSRSSKNCVIAMEGRAFARVTTDNMRKRRTNTSAQSRCPSSAVLLTYSYFYSQIPRACTLLQIFVGCIVWDMRRRT